jgi:hypothetical protein
VSKAIMHFGDIEWTSIRMPDLRLSVERRSRKPYLRSSAKTAAKWVRRYQREGRSGLRDRSSRPQHSPRRCHSDLVVRVEAFRRQRWTGIRIALATGLSRATVSRILRRLHLSRMRDLEPPPPVIRYEHPLPGDLLHLDIKKIGRFQAVGCRITGNRRGRIHRAGWEYVHVAIDDHSRIAFSQILLNQKASSAAAFLEAAVAYYARLDIAIRRLLTDNGPVIAPASFAASVTSSASPTVSLALTPRAPITKQNASSKPPSANGPMLVPTTTPKSVPPNCPPGSTSTTGTARMLV